MSTSTEQIKTIIQQCEHTHPCEPTVDCLQQRETKKLKNSYTFNEQTLTKKTYYTLLININNC